MSAHQSTKGIHRDEILAVYMAVKDALGETFTADALIEYIKLYRKRDLMLVRVPMPIEWTGLCCALVDGDVILIRDGMDQILDYMTLCHEAGHLVCDHVAEIPMTRENFARKPEELLEYILFRKLQAQTEESDEVKEYIAESIGMLLMKCIIKKGSAMPDFAQNLYGGE